MKLIVNGNWLLGLWLWLPMPAMALAHPGEPERKIEEIGSWVIRCTGDAKPDPQACEIRHRVWLMAPAGGRPSAAFEIRARHGFPVPVIAVHGVPIPEAAGTLLALATDASVQFGADPPIGLSCGFAQESLSCAPARADAQTASVRLRQARNAVIRLHLAASAGPKAPIAIPDQLRSLDLSRTADAIRRLSPAEGADTRWDLHDLLDWLARQLGFAGGLDDLLRWLFGQVATLQKGGG